MATARACDKCGGARGGVESTFGDDMLPCWTCGACAVCGGCGLATVAVQPNVMWSDKSAKFIAPVYVPALRQYMHPGGTGACVLCVGCRLPCINWTSPYVFEVMPGSCVVDGQLKCARCTMTCACGCGMAFAQYCMQERRMACHVSNVPIRDDGTWWVPEHRPCATCGERVGHDDQSGNPNPPPVGICFRCGKCVHGRIRPRETDSPDQSGLILASGGRDLHAHRACLKCRKCQGGPVLTQTNHGFSVRKLAAEDEGVYDVVHMDCRQCIICKGYGALTFKVPGKGARQRTKKAELVWRHTPHGKGWVHAPCVDEPPAKRAKLDALE